jgi:hypothetical protein
MTNMFFAGCESLMEDDTVEAEAKVTITPEEQAAEVAEAEEQATEQAETTAEVEQGAQQTELVFRKFDEIDRMIKHVETFGVDKAFLSLCNHNNVLNKSFGLGLPAVESFYEQPSPYSAVSQAAMEGLKEAASKVWEFIKRMIARAGDWLVRIVKLYDLRISRAEKQLANLKNSYKFVNEWGEGKSDTKVHAVEVLETYYSKLRQEVERGGKLVEAADGEGMVFEDTTTGREPDASKKKATLPQAGQEVKSISKEDVKKFLDIAEKGIADAKKTLSNTGRLRKTVSNLNTKVRVAEKEGDAEKMKKKVTLLTNAIKVSNRCIGNMISDVAGNALKAAAAAIADHKKEEKKEDKK